MIEGVNKFRKMNLGFVILFFLGFIIILLNCFFVSILLLRKIIYNLGLLYLKKKWCLL